jgi:hypothetical protein
MFRSANNYTLRPNSRCLIPAADDRDPPRLESLDSVQEAAMRELLEVLAYSSASLWQAEACQALEEWWIDGALYRPRSG